MALDVLLVNIHSNRNQWVLHPPLGLAYIAATLLGDGFSVEILDGNTPPQRPGNLLLGEIERRRPAIVGVSLFTPDLPTFGALLPGLQRLLARGAIGHLVLGGHHATHHPAIVGQIGCRWGIARDGEMPMLGLCRALLRGQGEAERVPGVVSVRDGSSVLCEPGRHPKLDDLPFPARHLLDGAAYFNPLSTRRITSLIMARGCPYSCSFCSGSADASTRPIRYRSAENVLAELREVRSRHAVEYVEFVDETFTLNRKLVRSVCEGMEGMGLKFGCQTRADAVDPEILAALARAGCDKIAYGIDAGTEAVRAEVAGKPIPDERFRSVFRWTREAGIRSVANIIFGFPGEERSQARQALAFVRSLRPSFANMQPLAIFPATRIYERALAEGKIDEGVWARMVSEQGGVMPLYEQPELGMDHEWLAGFGRSSVWRFYTRPDQVLRLLRGTRSAADVLNWARIAAGIHRYYFRS